MSFNNVSVEEMQRRYRQLESAAVSYKRMFHDMQDQYNRAMDKMVTKHDLMLDAQKKCRQQAATIARLEKQLGIDDEL